MKYLYRILRLFFCPHKYKLTLHGPIHLDGKPVGSYYDKTCYYCGKVKRFESCI